MNNGNMFEPQINPDGNNNNFNQGNNQVNPDELRSLDQQMNNPNPEPNNGFNYGNMGNNPNNFNGNNMPNNNNMNNNMANNNMNNNMANNMPNNNMNQMPYNNMPNNNMNMGNPNNYNGNMPNNNMNQMPYNGMNNQGSMPYGGQMPKQGGNNTGAMIISILLIIAIGVGVYFVFFSGGTKTLACTGNYMGIDAEYEVVAKNNKIKTAHIKMTIDIPKYARQNGVDPEYVDRSKLKLCGTISDETLNITSCNEKIENDIYTAEMDAIVKSGSNVNDKIDDFKSYYESGGFTCNYK